MIPRYAYSNPDNINVANGLRKWQQSCITGRAHNRQRTQIQSTFLANRDRISMLTIKMAAFTNDNCFIIVLETFT
jgi:hypothetical protein